MKQRVGFAGLGLMGSRMARNVGAKGFPLTVWNRNAERAVPFRPNAAVAATPRDLAAASDVVVTMLADPPAVEHVYTGPEGLLAGARPGTRFVDMSTVGPIFARRLHALVRQARSTLLEAPVTGSKLGAEQGTLVIMTSGERPLHDELLELLGTMGTKVIYAGGDGAANQLKLIGNLIISMMLEGFCEGLVMGRKAGLDPETIIELVMASGYTSPYFRFKGDAIRKRDFDTHFSIDLMHKDLSLALDAGTELSMPLPGGAAVREIYQAARAMGFGCEDICATVKVVEALARAEVR
ncbi:MAG: NAD(P)-dependent oxidoreductase [Acidobacteriota bacterium]